MSRTDPPSPLAPAFVVADLCKVYATGAGDVHALRGVDLRIEAGETLVLLGPSGSGKSTLLNILGGLDRPTSGSVRFHDLPQTQSEPAASARQGQSRRRRLIVVKAAMDDAPQIVSVKGRPSATFGPWPGSGDLRPSPFSRRLAAARRALTRRPGWLGQDGLHR
jgi:energy-coupling factor transporter ATP-binding protein EcfA2